MKEKYRFKFYKIKIKIYYSLGLWNPLQTHLDLLFETNSGYKFGRNSWRVRLKMRCARLSSQRPTLLIQSLRLYKEKLSVRNAIDETMMAVWSERLHNTPINTIIERIMHLTLWCSAQSFFVKGLIIIELRQ